jgi:hypothetical protein
VGGGGGGRGPRGARAAEPAGLQSVRVSGCASIGIPSIGARAPAHRRKKGAGVGGHVCAG